MLRPLALPCVATRLCVCVCLCVCLVLDPATACPLSRTMRRCVWIQGVAYASTCVCACVWIANQRESLGHVYEVTGDISAGKGVHFTAAPRRVSEVPKEALGKPGPGAYMESKPFVPPPFPIDPHP
jgi:hypothetical protein